MTVKLLHQFRLWQPDILDCVCCEKSVLNIKEGRLGLFGSAAGNQREVAGFLRVASKKGAPSAIGNAVHVVMPGVHIQGVRRYCAGPDVEHDWQTFARDRI